MLYQPQRVADLLLVPGAAQTAQHPGPVDPEPGRAHRVHRLVDQPHPALGQAQAALAVPAAPGRDHRLGQHVLQLDPVAVLVGGAVVAGAGRVGLGPVVRAQGVRQHLLGDHVPQFQGPFQHAQLLGEGVAPAGRAGGVQGGRQGAGRIVRVVPVVGEPGGQRVAGDQLRLGLHGERELAVDPVPFAGQQVVRDRLADQRVPEPVALALAVRAQDVGADGRPQRLDQRLLVVVQDGGQQGVFDVRAALGGDPHHPLGLLVQALDPHQQDVPQRVGQPGAAAVVEGGGQLLDEEGVPLRAAVDPVHQLAVGGGGAQDAGQLGGHLPAVEPLQLQPLDGAQPFELGEEGAQRVAAVQVVAAVGGDQQHPGAVQGAHQEGEQLAGGAVGPVQVLDGEDEGTLRAEPFEQPRGVLEQPGPAVLVVRFAVRLAQLGEQPGEMALAAGRGGLQLGAQRAVQPAQRGGQRRVRQALGADLQTAAERDDRSPVDGALQELLQQPGLADAGLAADQDGLRTAGARPAQRVGQFGDLAATADEDGADRYLLHGGEHAIAGGARPRGYLPRRTPGGGDAHSQRLPLHCSVGTVLVPCRQHSV